MFTVSLMMTSICVPRLLHVQNKKCHFNICLVICILSRTLSHLTYSASRMTELKLSADGERRVLRTAHVTGMRFHGMHSIMRSLNRCADNTYL